MFILSLCRRLDSEPTNLPGSSPQPYDTISIVSTPLEAKVIPITGSATTLQIELGDSMHAFSSPVVCV